MFTEDRIRELLRDLARKQKRKRTGLIAGVTLRKALEACEKVAKYFELEKMELCGGHRILTHYGISRVDGLMVQSDYATPFTEVSYKNGEFRITRFERTKCKNCGLWFQVKSEDRYIGEALGRLRMQVLLSSVTILALDGEAVTFEFSCEL